MIENPGETPDFAIFASLNKDGAFPAIDPASICKSSHLSKGMPCERGHCSH